MLVDLAVDGSRLHELLVRAARGDSPVVEHDDLVRERERNSAVPMLMNGITASVAKASRQSKTTRSTAVPPRRSVLWASVVTPSVTSWSIASTSFVILLMRTPARFRS